MYGAARNDTLMVLAKPGTGRSGRLVMHDGDLDDAATAGAAQAAARQGALGVCIPKYVKNGS